MELSVECWESCGEEFPVHAPDRQDPALIEGVVVQCPHCGVSYRFTVDGDGEPDLQSMGDSLGDNIDDVRSDENTNF